MASERGIAAIVSVVSISSIVLVLSGGFLYVTLLNTRSLQDETNSAQGYYASESGMEDAIHRVRNNLNVTSPIVFSVGGAVATTTVVTAGNTSTITSEGARRNAVRKSKVVLSLTSDQVDFFYGVQVGEGGVVMSQNSQVTGNIYSNGDVTGASGAKISGDLVVAGNVSESTQARAMVCNQDQVVGQTNPQIDFAQSFTAPSSSALAKISLYIKKNGNPGSRTVYIANDVSGSPAQTSIASATLSSSLVTGSYGWIDVVFSSPPSLTSGNTYWIVLDASQHNSNYWIWCRDQNNGYGNGVGKYKQDWNTGGSWTQITGDLNFRTYFGSGVRTLSNATVTGTARANSIVSSSICGDAYYQSIDASSLNFLNSPTTPTCSTPLTNGTAYPDSPDQPLAPLPISQANITQWKADATAGGVWSGDYTVSTNTSLGPKEITGNLDMTSNNKTLTVTGTLWVRGNVDISNGSAIRCSASYGANSCLVIADGWIHAANNGTFAGSGTAGSYLMLLSTLACTGAPGTGCGHHDGAIDVHNNASGVIFYAQNGMINLHNGVNVTQATGYKLQLDNNAIVTYEQGIASTSFSSGPGAGWKISDWKEIP